MRIELALHLAHLLALHLIDNESWHRGNGAFAFATATEKLFAVLEAQYLTHAALLADLQSLPFDRRLLPDSDVTEGMLYEYLPPRPVAEIDAELKAIEAEIQELLGGLAR